MIVRHEFYGISDQIGKIIFAHPFWRQRSHFQRYLQLKVFFRLPVFTYERGTCHFGYDANSPHGIYPIRKPITFYKRNVRAHLPFLFTDHSHTYWQFSVVVFSHFSFISMEHFSTAYGKRNCMWEFKKCAYSYYNNLYSSGKNIAKVLLKAKM